MVFDYLDAGADDEITIRRNKDAYSQLELHYHILAGLKPPLNMGTRIMGRDVDLPFFPAPTVRRGGAGVGGDTDRQTFVCTTTTS